MTPDVANLVSTAQRLRQHGRFADAKIAAERALEIEPQDASAWFNLGAALGGLGDLAGAEAAYRRALERDPQYAEAWSNLAGLLRAAGRVEEGLAAYRRALEANPRLAPVWSNFGNVLCDLRRYDDAEAACRRAVELDERFVPGWLNLGKVLHQTKRPADARAACERAVQLTPQLPEAWAGLGNALMALRQFADAIDAYRKALSLHPQSPDFHTNLGIALRRIGLDSDGVASLRRALEIDPSHPFASWNLGMALLERGQLEEGWARYEARWARPESPRRRFPARGGPPFGGSALLWGEQGVGDHILYARMAAEAAQAGTTVTLETDARLVPLFRRSFPDVTVVPQTDPPQVDPARFDHVLPLGSLGRWLRGSFEAFPRHHGYLVADAGTTTAYRQTLARMLPQGSFIVGIAWRSSNPELANEKSAPLGEWAPLLTLPGASFVSLQYGDVAEERREAERRFGIRIAAVPGLDVFSDLDGLAAAQAACDLVITTSTINAHLSGALGRHDWLLLPRRIGGLWYWFADRGDCPWYPGLSLVRQSQDGDWREAMALAAHRLGARLARAS